MPDRNDRITPAAAAAQQQARINADRARADAANAARAAADRAAKQQGEARTNIPKGDPYK